MKKSENMIDATFKFLQAYLQIVKNGRKQPAIPIQSFFPVFHERKEPKNVKKRHLEFKNLKTEKIQQKIPLS